MKIVRTPTRAEGGITADERAQMDEIAREWIAIARRTDTVDRAEITDAIERLYAAADLPAPRVVVAPSPLTMVFAAGAAAAIWHSRGASATAAATSDATADATEGAARVATHVATYAATDAATAAATRAATDAATRAATRAATDAATYDATRAATYDATHVATYAATDAATRAATDAATRAATDAATDVPTRDATFAATAAATRDATRDATADATYDATYGATAAATYDATYGATAAATYDATYGAARVAIEGATDAATEGATEGAARVACANLAGTLGVACAKRVLRCYQGGAYWAGLEAYLCAARDILGLRLPEHEKYAAWEAAARAAPFRIMHEKFCMVSDFPEVLRWDEDNRPHCEDGPSHRWRDGWSLYHWHGVRVPGHWIERPRDVDPAEVLACENVEQRAAGVAIIGMQRIIDRLDVTVLDHDPDPQHGDLLAVKMPGLDRPGRYLRAECPRNGTIIEGVPYEDENGRPIETVRHAQAWRVGLTPEEFRFPEIRT